MADADIVEAVADTVAEKTADVVEASQERIAAAEDTAQAIADAALQTELGQRVSALQKDIDQWHAEFLQLSDQVVQLEMRQKAQMEEIMSKLPPQTMEPVVLVTPAVPLTPPALPPVVPITEPPPFVEAGAVPPAPERETKAGRGRRMI